MTIRQRLLHYCTATALLSASLSGAAVVGAPAASAAACPTDDWVQIGSTDVCELRYTSVGEHTWTVPIGVTSIDVLVVGGGGSGETPNSRNGAGGGGGGGIAVLRNYSVTANTAFSVVVQPDSSGNRRLYERSEFKQGATVLAYGTPGRKGSLYAGGIGGSGYVASGLTGDSFNGKSGNRGSSDGVYTRAVPGQLVNQGLFQYTGTSPSSPQEWGGGGGGGLDGDGGFKGSTFRNHFSPNSGGGGGGGGGYNSIVSRGLDGQAGIVVIRTQPPSRQLTEVSAPSTAANGETLGSPSVVRVIELGTSNPVSGVVVTATIESSPGGSPSLTGTTATTGADGEATFSALAIRGPTGDYTLTFSAAGAVSVTSSVITLSAGAAAAAQSVITAASTTVSTEQTTTVTVQAKDSAGNTVTAGGDTVVLTPTAGSIGSIADNGDGTYTGTFTAPASTGVVTISGTLNGSAIGTSASVTVKGSQIVTWMPTNTALTMPTATISPDAFASTSGDGSISYQVHSAGTSGCSISGSSSPFTLTYTAAGTCTVRATAVDTATYAEAFIDVDFEISLATQSITASSTATRLRPGQSATVSDSGSTGGGAITWTNTTPSKCTLVFPTVTADANGSCILAVDIAADATYAAASDTITITVFTPGGGGGSGGGSGGGGGSSGGSGGGSSSGGTSTSGGSGSSSGASGSGASGSAAGGGGGSAGAIQSQDDVAVPGTGSSTRGRALPPPPEDVNVQQIPGRARSSVLIKQPAGAAGLQVASTVVVVRNVQGKVISRINVALKRGQGEIEVTVPFVADGYTVDVYNVNDVGVSTGALTRSPLIRATTITKRMASGQPSLFGTMLGKPIIFNGGSAALDARDKKQLRAIARQAKASNERLFVTGFARKGGGTKTELASLSTKRAHAAARYLSKQGVRVWIRYWGAGSLNGTGALSDRRVEVRTSAKPIPRTLVP